MQVDDSHIRKLFGGVKDDFKTQSQKISNLADTVQGMDSAMDEMKYKVKSVGSNFEDLKKKVAEVSKKGDAGNAKFVGLQ